MALGSYPYTQTILLTSDAVKGLMQRCLFTDEELQAAPVGKKPAGAKSVRGVSKTFILHRTRLTGIKYDLALLLNQLDDTFKTTGGGGWSISRARYTKNGVRWGDDEDVETLVVLCIGTGLCHFPLRRPSWKTLPDGLPYLTIDSDACDKARVVMH